MPILKRGWNTREQAKVWQQQATIPRKHLSAHQSEKKSDRRLQPIANGESGIGKSETLFVRSDRFKKKSERVRKVSRELASHTQNS